MPRIIAYSATSRVERGAPCYRERPLGLRLPSKRASPFFGGYPSSNRTCSFPAYGSPCGTGFISFASLRPSAPFHIDSDGCSSIWTSGFRRAATWRIVPYCSLSTLLFSPFDLHRPFYTQRPFASTGIAPLHLHCDSPLCPGGLPHSGHPSHGLLGPSGYPLASLGPHCVRRVCPNHISVCL